MAKNPKKPLEAYPRVFLDLELYRPPRSGGQGRNPFFHTNTKIILAAIAVEDEKGLLREEYLTEWTLREPKLLRKLIEILSETVSHAGRRPLLIGYNILSLDIPVIIYRAHHLLPPRETRGLEALLYRRFLPVDMFQQVLPLYEGPGLPSFAWLESRLSPGIASKKSGYRIHEFYEQGRYEEILDYSRDEMMRLRRTYRLLMKSSIK